MELHQTAALALALTVIPGNSTLAEQTPAVEDAVPLEEQVAAELVQISGVVRERGTRRPLVGVEVTALAEGEALAFGVTDQNGGFSLEVGAWAFTVLIPTGGRAPLEVDVQADSEQQWSRTFYIRAPDSGYETVVRARRIQRQVAEQEVTREEVEALAGGTGDALATVQALPSVGRVAPQQGGTVDSEGLVLRGSAQGDSRVFLEGLEIPILYHFGDLRSSFNSYFLKSIDFAPGNFAADYGRAIGGVVNLRVRDPADDGIHGQLDINVYDASIAVEGPVGRGWSLGGAFRRSWVDSLIPLLVPQSVGVGFDPAPRFYDYQFIASWRPDARRRLQLIYYGSQDRFIINFPKLRSDPALRGGLDYRVMFHNLQVSYRERLNDRLTQETSARVSYTPNEFSVGTEIFRDEQLVQLAARNTWEYRASRRLSLRAGLDLVVEQAFFEEQSSLQLEGEPRGPASTQQLFSSSGKATVVWPALFAELRLSPVSQLTIISSLRADYFSTVDAVTFDPRFTVLYRPHETTVLSAGVGLYQQPPTRRESDDQSGNSDLDPARAVHLSVGVEQRLSDYVTIEVTGFYKPLERLVSRNPFASFDNQTVPLLSEGYGRIGGIEALIRARYRDWFFGWIAYTYQRSLRTDPVTEEERPFDVDQPHMLTVVARSKLGAGFSASLRFRLVSGTPVTPVAGSLYYTASDTYVPLYGEANSDRLALFHQLDFRLDWTRAFDLWRLSLYLDVQNVYNRQNAIGQSFNYDYSEVTTTGCCLVLPILGMRGNW
jgi:hypothetical protein